MPGNRLKTACFERDLCLKAWGRGLAVSSGFGFDLGNEIRRHRNRLCPQIREDEVPCHVPQREEQAVREFFPGPLTGERAHFRSRLVLHIVQVISGFLMAPRAKKL